MIETQLRLEVHRRENVVVAKRGTVPDVAAPYSPAYETYRAALPEAVQWQPPQASETAVDSPTLYNYSRWQTPRPSHIIPYLLAY
jgi:hypothetical protein